ncbi:MAG TPA: response regulator transcription factor [Chromatiaceae bacterium]|nr:response regulator transcription factor [Chromatiaceae bacterium]
MRLLLVEDDPLLGDGIQTGLRQDGYTVDWIQNGLEADQAVRIGNFDLIIMDLNLPGLPGLEVLQRLRARGNSTPVLILTARDATSDRVAGLDAGADDYLVKPFDFPELNARLRALLRRSSGRATPIMCNGPLCIDPAAHVVTLDKRPIPLPQREFAILEALLNNAGRVMSRSHIEESIYGWDTEVGSNAIEVHIHHLRKKLGSEWIRTVRGVGYMMEKHS